MCKVAILSPSRLPETAIGRAGVELYRSQRSGLGIVAVYEEDGSFRYEVGKWTDPTADEIHDFVRENYDDPKPRYFIVHGRLATSGDRTSVTGTHPISVDCPSCNVDYVLHNGVYKKGPITGWIRQLNEEGHKFTTKVDTELIAHRFEKVPETIDSANEMVSEAHAGYEQAIILLNEDRMFVYSDRKYRIDEHGEMYMTYDEYMNPDAKKNYSMVIVEAGGAN